jgi:hypothetical protein
MAAAAVICWLRCSISLSKIPAPARKTGFDLGEGMVPIGLADDKIGRALQQRQERNQEKEQPATETAESKFQR